MDSELSDILNQLIESVKTLNSTPSPKPKGYASSWPDVVHDYMEAYGWEQARYPRLVPTPAQISRMEQVIFEWLPAMELDDRRLAWARACGYSWGRIANMVGCSDKTAKHRFGLILLMIREKSRKKGDGDIDKNK